MFDLSIALVLLPGWTDGKDIPMSANVKEQTKRMKKVPNATRYIVDKRLFWVMWANKGMCGYWPLFICRTCIQHFYLFAEEMCRIYLLNNNLAPPN